MLRQYQMAGLTPQAVIHVGEAASTAPHATLSWCFSGIQNPSGSQNFECDRRRSWIIMWNSTTAWNTGKQPDLVLSFSNALSQTLSLAVQCFLEGWNFLASFPRRFQLGRKVAQNVDGFETKCQNKQLAWDGTFIFSSSCINIASLRGKNHSLGIIGRDKQRCDTLLLSDKDLFAHKVDQPRQ